MPVSKSRVYLLRSLPFVPHVVSLGWKVNLTRMMAVASQVLTCCSRSSHKHVSYESNLETDLLNKFILASQIIS